MNVRQSQQLGLGHAVLYARKLIGDKPFVVVLPDILLDDSDASHLRYNLAAMIAGFESTGFSQALARELPADTLSEYSVIHTETPLNNVGDYSRITEFIEKPAAEEEEEEEEEGEFYIGAVGGSVLSADIWPLLEATEPGAWDRIQLTDAIARLNRQQSVEASLLIGESYDCGRNWAICKPLCITV